MNLKSTHLGEKKIINYHIFYTIVPFDCLSYSELNISTTSLILSLIETLKSEMNVLAAALKKHENLAVIS